MSLPKTELRIAGTLLVAGLLAVSSSVFAHNKVVVIPMAGDDIMPKPTSPATKNSPPNSDYILNGLFTVLDKVTGLEWQRLDDNIQRTFSDAFQYCVDLSLDSKVDWRLPLIAELVSLVDYGAASPSINAVTFPATNSSSYWSASSSALSAGSGWEVRFNDGAVDGEPFTSPHYVRCVR